MDAYSGNIERRVTRTPSLEKNVSNMERIMAGAGGAFLFAYGLSRRSPAGVVLAAAGGLLLHRAATGYCPVYKALDLNTAAMEREWIDHRPLRIEENMTVLRPRDEVYASWRRFEKFPLFMRHVESVQPIDPTRSRWRVRLPGGMGRAEWVSQIMTDQKNERIAWRSQPDGDLQNSGEVLFEDAPDYRGTEVRVRMEFLPPAGRMGQLASSLAHPAFRRMVREDIRRLKSLLEAGEVSIH